MFDTSDVSFLLFLKYLLKRQYFISDKSECIQLYTCSFCQRDGEAYIV